MVATVVLESYAQTLVMLHRQCAWDCTNLIDRNNSSPPPEFTFEVDHLVLYFSGVVINEIPTCTAHEKRELTNLLHAGYIALLRHTADAARTATASLPIRLFDRLLGDRTLRDQYDKFSQIYGEFLASPYRKSSLADSPDWIAILFCFVARLTRLRTPEGTRICMALDDSRVVAIENRIQKYLDDCRDVLLSRAGGSEAR